MKNTIEIAYLISGLILPLFYVPQILKCLKDETRLASYSLAKSFCQLLLRLPALAFAFYVVDNAFMSFVLVFDVVGRALELGVAVHSLKRQNVQLADIASRLNPARTFSKMSVCEDSVTP